MTSRYQPGNRGTHQTLLVGNPRSGKASRQAAGRARKGDAKMKAVILAGGLGSRLSEETVLRPKPMVEIGGKPILWHIMNIYGAHGVDEFVIALGYKVRRRQGLLPELLRVQQRPLDRPRERQGDHPRGQPAQVEDPPRRHRALDRRPAGACSGCATGSSPDETFFFTYGDGVADLDVGATLRFHRQHGKLATVTTVRAARALRPASGSRATTSRSSSRSRRAGEGWINGGFFVLDCKAIDYIDDDETIWEREPLERLARDGQLVGFRHDGFWSCMDTLKEKLMLEDLWAAGDAPWQIWK